MGYFCILHINQTNTFQIIDLLWSRIFAAFFPGKVFPGNVYQINICQTSNNEVSVVSDNDFY